MDVGEVVKAIKGSLTRKGVNLVCHLPAASNQISSDRKGQLLKKRNLQVAIIEAWHAHSLTAVAWNQSKRLSVQQLP